MGKEKIILFLLLGLFVLNAKPVNAQLEKGHIVIEPYYGFPNFGKLIANLGANALNDNSLGIIDNVEDIVNDYVSEYTTEQIRINGDIGMTVGGLGPMGGRAEYVIVDGLAVGVDFIYNSTSVNFGIDSLDVNDNVVGTFNVGYTMHRIRAQIRANYHFVRKKMLDVYCGLGIGMNTRIHKIESDIFDWDISQSYTGAYPISARTCLGLRFYPVQWLGLGMEVGLGGPLVSFGISSRFNVLKNKSSSSGQL